MRRSKRLNKNIADGNGDTPNEEPAIFRLNEDCMRQIILLLSVKERIRLTRVCKKWHALIKLPWTDIKELKISFRRRRDHHRIKYTLPILKQILGYCGNSITSLTLGCWRETGYSKQIMLFIIKTCPNLSSLNLNGIKLYCKSVEALAENYSNLSHIALGWCQPGCTQAVSKLFSNNKKLKSVEISECYLLHGDCFSKLPAESIESLTFGPYCSFSISNILGVIGNFTKLRTLYIDQNCDFMDNLNELLGAIPNKTNLDTLKLDAYDNSEPLTNIRCYTNLRKIKLAYGTDELLSTIGQYCKQLSSVYLSGSYQVTDSGLKSLVSSLSIEELFIHDMTGISETFFADINMPSLKFFESFSNHQWTNESLRLLMLASNNLLQLRVSRSHQVYCNILINDALYYTSNRSSDEILKLFLEDDNLFPEVRNVSPRLIVKLQNTLLFDEDSD